MRSMVTMDEAKTLHFEIAHASLPKGPNGKAPMTEPVGATVRRAQKPERLMRLLSERNLKLLRLIRTAKPRTLAELSRLSGRPKASLTRTLARLNDLGIVELEKSRGRGKIPKVACDKVLLEVSFEVDENASDAS